MDKMWHWLLSSRRKISPINIKTNTTKFTAAIVLRQSQNAEILSLGVAQLALRAHQLLYGHQ